MDSSTDKKHEEDPPPPSGVDIGPISPTTTQSAPIAAKRKRRVVRTAVESSTSGTTTTSSTAPYVSQGHKDEGVGLHQQPISEPDDQVFDEQELHESSTITRTFTKTIKKSTEFVQSTSSSREYLVEEGSEVFSTPPATPQRLKHKVALYEKVWSSGNGNGNGAGAGAGIKRSADHMSQDSVLVSGQSSMDTSGSGADFNMGDENPFEIDVYEIEKRLREERRRGLAEAEAAKLAFQQIQLRATPQAKPRKVEIQEDLLASPFNVTLKTTSKISPGAVTGRIELEDHSSSSSPFNVTLRTTQRYRRNPPPAAAESHESPFNVILRTTTRHSSSSSLSPMSPDAKLASAHFIEGERTVREVQSADGVTTIVTSSMTSDGRKHEEKIFRHGEGYLSPRNSPHREVRATTPSRSVDMMAGGRRICIKLEQEEQQMETSSLEESFDQTDSYQTNRRLFKPNVSSETVSVETPANIDIIVGKSSTDIINHPHQHPGQRQYMQQVNVETNKTVEIPWQTQQQPQQHQFSQSVTTSPSTITTKTTTKITTTSHKHQSSCSESLESFETPLKEATSLTKTIQSHGSSPSEESQRGFVEKDRTTSTPSTAKLTSDPSRIGRSSPAHKYLYGETVDVERLGTTTGGGDLVKKRLERLNYGRDGLGHGSGELAPKTLLPHQQSAEISDDSDTEGAAANSIVIVPARSAALLESATGTSAITTSQYHQQQHSTPTSVPSHGTLTKSLPQHQTLHHQSTATSHSTNEYHEFQTTMAAINFARSNSQYDSHIKEKRGNFKSMRNVIHFKFFNATL